MQEQTVKVYVAFPTLPGLRRQFETAAEARAYERDNTFAAVAGLSIEQVVAAEDGTDPDLGLALERAGKACERARLDRGQRQRARPTPSEAAQQDPETEVVRAADLTRLRTGIGEASDEGGVLRGLERFLNDNPSLPEDAEMRARDMASARISELRVGMAP